MFVLIRRVAATAGCIVAVAAIAGTSRGQDSASLPPYPAPGRLVDVGGWRLHINCAGSSRAGEPTVVLESGIGAFSVDWALVQPLVAKSARVCSYDRAGSGWSDLGPDPRTMRQIVYELHTLLKNSGERLPVVLAGHSYGGALVRLYAMTYPSEVAGMVLVDAQHDDYLRATANGEVMASTLASGRAVPEVKTSGPLRESDLPAAALRQIRAMSTWNATHANEPPRDRLPIEAQRMRSWGTSQVKHAAATNNPFEGDELLALQAARKVQPFPLGDLPLVVLSRGNPDGDGANAEMHWERHRREQAELATRSHRGKLIVVPGTGHHIDIEKPDIVAAAILEVAGAARRAGSGSTASRRLPQSPAEQVSLRSAETRPKGPRMGQPYEATLHPPPGIPVKPNTLTIVSLLSIILLPFHISGDVVLGLDQGGPGFVFVVVPILLVMACGTLLLAERRSGHVIMFLGGLATLGMPIIHRNNGFTAAVAKGPGGLFFIWTLVALGVIGGLVMILSAHGLWALRSRKT